MNKNTKVHRNICRKCGQVTYWPRFDKDWGLCEDCEMVFESELVTWSEPFWTHVYKIDEKNAHAFKDFPVAIAGDPAKRLVIVSGTEAEHQKAWGIYKTIYCTWMPMREWQQSVWEIQRKRERALIAEANKWCEQYGSQYWRKTA